MSPSSLQTDLCDTLQMMINLQRSKITAMEINDYWLPATPSILLAGAALKIELVAGGVVVG